MSNISAQGLGLDAAGNDMAAIARAAEEAARPKTITAHTCHAVGCRQVVPPEMLFCKPHWMLLPLTLRKRVLIAYTPGQCQNTAKVKPAWIKAARAAIEYVLQLELPRLVARLKLPKGYDPALVKVRRVGVATVAIVQQDKPALVGHLATGEVREVKPESPAAAANDAQPEGKKL